MSRPLVVSALVIIAAIFIVLFASALQSHQHVKLLQRELDQAKQEVAQSKQARKEVQDNLSEANSSIEQLHKELDTAQSQLKEKDTHTGELTTELEKTKKDTYTQLAAEKEANQRQFETITNEATKKLSESEKRVGDLTKSN